MASSSSSSKAITLKLLIDTKAQKVVFGEASKELVDFLFNLLSLPVATVTRLLSKQCMVGSLGKLYGSIESLSEAYFQPNKSKDSILKPKFQLSSTDVPLLLGHDEEHDRKVKLYMCQDNHKYVSDNPASVCTYCRNSMSYEATWVAAPPKAVAGENGEEGGFVKGVVTYMVMDDLEVKPMSTISCLTLLNKFNVKEVGVLEEMVVNVGMEEGLKLLKASLQSEQVLTSVFLGRKSALEVVVTDQEKEVV